MFSWFTIVAGLAGALLAGCATYKPEPLPLEKLVQQFETRSLESPGLKHFLEQNLHRDFFNQPHDSWNFPELSLAAFYFHPALDVARAQLNITQAGAVTAAARPNPTLGVTPEYNFNAASGISPWIYGLNFDWPLETAGKRGYRIAKSHHLSDAARWNIHSAAWQVRTDLRNALVDYATAEKRIALLQNQKNIQAKIIASLEAQQKAGAISQFEITTARIAGARAQFEFADSQNRLAESRTRVAAAIGIPVEAIKNLKLVFDFNAAEFPSTAPELRRAALQNRGDVLSLLSEYAASESALQLEIARQYPDVHLGTGYQFDQGENKWSLGLTAELPVLNRNQGGIADAKARRAETAARFLALQAKVIAEMDRASVNYSGAQAQLEVAESLTAAQEKQRSALESQVKAGEIARPELLNSDLERAAIELQKFDASLKIQQALGDLENALQRPLDGVEFSKNPRAEERNDP